MRRLSFAVAVTLSAVLVLSACSDSTSPTAGGSAPPAATGGGAVSADESWGHVHNLTLDGSSLLLGTHEGLWQQEPGAGATLISEPPFDVMSFAGNDERLFASGHPEAGSDLPADLGLRESTDGGVSWQSVSLEGEVDFHRLAASGRVVVGLSAHDGRLLRSEDSGATWDDLGTPPVFDLAMDPDDSKTVLATTEQGPAISADGGRTFSSIPDAPLLALLAWSAPRVYGVTPEGDVYASTDKGSSWTQAGSVGEAPSAIAADGKRVVVLAGSTIMESSDAGATFAPRITGLEGH